MSKFLDGLMDDEDELDLKIIEQLFIGCGVLN